MAAWKRKGGLEKYYDKIVNGMTERGYERAFAEAIFEQIKGFSGIRLPGKPRRQLCAAGLRLMLDQAARTRRLSHRPAQQPAHGFLHPSQLVQDARRHGVEVRAVDVMHSAVETTLEDRLTRPPCAWACRVSRLRTASAQRIVAERHKAPLTAPRNWPRARLEQSEMKLLAAGGALASLSGHRRQQYGTPPPQCMPHPRCCRMRPSMKTSGNCPQPPRAKTCSGTMPSLGLTLRSHPMALLRAKLDRYKLKTSEELRHIPNGRIVRTAGIVTLRQRPQTANGTVFVSLEDEHGSTQVIVAPGARGQRQVLLGSRLLAVKGRWQREARYAT